MLISIVRTINYDLPIFYEITQTYSTTKISLDKGCFEEGNISKIYARYIQVALL
jgi:hypothetical protein